MDPFRVGEVGANGTLGIGAMTGVAVALAVEEAVPERDGRGRDGGGGLSHGRTSAEHGGESEQ